jgi:hypothetical protein
MLHRSLIGPLLIATLLGLSAAPARADDRATAQELFQQGKDLMSAGKTAEACAKFAAAADLVQTVGVRLNLAACYEKIGRTASAWTRYDEALTLAERNGDAAAASFAQSAKIALTPRLSSLAILVPTEAALPGLEVTRDGQKVPQAAWGVPVPVDPGDHDLAASAPGHAAWSTKTRVSGPGKAEVQVPVLAIAAIVPEPTATPNEETTPGAKTGLFSGPGGTQRVIAVSAAGAGVVALGIGSFFGIEMLSKKQTATSSGHCGTEGCGALSQDAVAAGNMATIGFVAGGLLVAGGAVVWLTAPSSKPATTAAIVPIAGSGGGGVGIQGSW